MILEPCRALLPVTPSTSFGARGCYYYLYLTIQSLSVPLSIRPPALALAALRSSRRRAVDVCSPPPRSPQHDFGLFFVFSLYHLVPVLIFPPLEILRRRLDLVSIVSSCFDSVWFLRSVYFGSVPSFRFILTGITPPVFVRLVVSVSVPSFRFFSYPCCRGR